MDEDVTRRLAAWSGIAAATLFTIGNAVWALGMPSGGTPTAEVVSFYEGRAVRIVVGASVSVLSLAVLVLFAAALRSVIVRTMDDEVLATTAFAGLVVTVAAGLGAETVNMIGGLRAAEGRVDPALARSVHEISQMFGSVASGGRSRGVRACAGGRGAAQRASHAEVRRRHQRRLRCRGTDSLVVPQRGARRPPDPGHPHRFASPAAWALAPDGPRDVTSVIAEF